MQPPGLRRAAVLGLLLLPAAAGADSFVADSAQVRGLPAGPYCSPGVAAWMAVYTTATPPASPSIVKGLRFDKVRERVSSLRGSSACLAGRSFLIVRNGGSIGCRAANGDSFTVNLTADSLSKLILVNVCPGAGSTHATTGQLEVGDVLVAPLFVRRNGATLLVIGPVENDSTVVVDFQREFVRTKKMGREDCSASFAVGPPTIACTQP